MLNRMASALLLATIGLACLMTQSEARDILARQYSPSDFKQCGGIGGPCKGPHCRDAPFKLPNAGCATGLKCYRVNQYYWGCDTHQPPTSKPTKPAPASHPTQPTRSYKGSDFKQCGGIGGTCSHHKGNQCRDAPYSLPNAGCTHGLKCYRVSQYHWGCDTHQPPTSKPTKPAPASHPTRPTRSYKPSDFKQCGGTGGTCKHHKGNQCRDAPYSLPNAGCTHGLKCYRVSQYHWGCDTHQPPTSRPTPSYQPSDFKQCGGLGGKCKGSQCRDAPYSLPNAGCASGLQCYRDSKYYWGCDTHQPA